MKRVVQTIDLSAALLFAIYLISSCCHNDGATFMKMFRFTCFMAVYLCTRLMLEANSRIADILMLCCLMLCCLNESALAYMQVFGLKASGHYAYACTGTFHNPGPFAGFMAVCMCTLFAYAAKGSCRLLRYLSLAAGLVALPLMPLSESRAGMLALVSGMACLAMTVPAIQAMACRHIVLLSVIVLTAMAGVYLIGKGSANSRILTARVSAGAVLHGGICGAGPGHFGGAYATEQARFFSTPGKHIRYESMADFPEYAFNEFLQAGVEAGPAAMVLTAALILSALSVLLQRGIFWAYGLAALTVFSLFSYPFSLAQFIIPTAFCTAAAARSKQGAKYRKTHALSLTIMFAATALLLFRQMPEYKARMQASEEWNHMSRWYESGMYEYVVNDYAGIADRMDHSAEFLFQYGNALSRTGNICLSDSILKKGTEISSDAMFWNILGKNRQAASDCINAGKMYRHAFQIAPDRLYPLYLMATLYLEQKDTARFVAAAEKVVTFKPKIESERTLTLKHELAEMLKQVKEAKDSGK